MKNIALVSEKKKNIVSNICSIAEKTPIVKRLIIFGSGITEECKDDSDLDICVDISCDTKDLRLFDLRASVNRACDYNCDFVVYNHIGDALKCEIDKKGVVVYES